MQFTLTTQTATLAAHQRPLPTGYTFRPMNEQDIPELAALYFKVYPRSVVEEMTLAIEEMKMTFAGDFGELLLDLSPVVVTEREIVSAIMTVHNAPWEHTPEGLFVIETFTHPQFRRQGLASAGLTHMANMAAKLGYGRVGLRVESKNIGAMTLYQGLGFVQWK